jgi:predicted O-linked N-acetylglucosamine transferase (SPINDLY family)
MSTIPQLIQQAIQYHQAGEWHQAETLYRQLLQIVPNHSEALQLLGVIALQRSHFDEAITLIKKAISFNNKVPSYYSNLGIALSAKGQLDEARTCYQQALTLNPNYAEAHNNLGNVFKEQGKLEAAIECYQRAFALNPSYIDALNGLGNALRTQGQLADARDCYQRVLSLNPTSVETHFNLGMVLREQYQLTEAATCYQRALTLNPNYIHAHINLGETLSELGKITEAIQHYRNALALNPTYAEVHSNLVYAMNFSEQYDTATIFSEHQQFNIQQALPFATVIKPHRNDRHPQRRLKIGYLSPDFRKHSLAYFIEPVLAHHDHQQFEFFCYYNQTVIDQVTQRFQQYADHWLNCVGLSDEILAERIRQDSIDILVDLAGHTAGNRLLVLARKPAPLQVFHTVGYANTTGLLTIDYRLTDRYADPEGMTEQFSSEILIRMPASYYCYHPEEDSPPVNDLPARQHGYVTFGSFNSTAKLNDSTLVRWAKVLQAIPDSRLTLMTKSLQDPILQQTLQHQLATLGISSKRLTMGYASSPEETLTAYHQIDIGLDTYPFNGATTTCQALWMGVPVVTLVGTTPAARAGLSLLSTVGLTELIAYTPEDYVKIGIQLANDLDYLQQLRATLRARMQTSPLMDGASFTRHLEVAYRQMWEQWCARPRYDNGES